MERYGTDLLLKLDGERMLVHVARDEASGERTLKVGGREGIDRGVTVWRIRSWPLHNEA